MDSMNTRSRRTNRVALAPSLENLEGRQLMTAMPHVRFQEIVVGGAIELLIKGTKKADVIHIADNGSVATGNIRVTLGDGTVYTSKAAIKQIDVSAGAGNDQVTYNLTGDLVASRTVHIDLGAGNDQFAGQVTGNISTNGTLDLEVYGNTGNDTLSINQTGATKAGTFFPYLDGGAGNDTISFKSTGDIAVDGTVGPALLGGAGNDLITCDYAGVINGSYLYNMAIDGGDGNDNISVNVTPAASSTGKIGTSAVTPAVVSGGAGNDNIRFAVVVDPAHTALRVNALVIGSTGTDTIMRTKNVNSDLTNENDGIIFAQGS